MRILETCLYVHDLEHAEAFYRALGFEFVSRVAGRHVFFRAGESMLLLFDPEASVVAGELPAHVAPPGGHVCFAAARDEIDDWYAKLEAMGVRVQRYAWSRDRGESLYFRDPDGNLLEIAPPSIWGLEPS
jgi:catechol 2,3-dioxygenase-like lactoylglutathione lyase family enzyme